MSNLQKLPLKGLLFIFFGTLLLLNTLDIISWAYWLFFLALIFPMILIYTGVRVIGSTSPKVRPLIDGGLIVVLIGSVLFFQFVFAGSITVYTAEGTIPIDRSVEQINLDISMHGEITIADTEASEGITYRFSATEENQEPTVEEQDGTLNIAMKQEYENTLFSWIRILSTDNFEFPESSFLIGGTQDTPISLTLQQSISDATLTFETIVIESLHLDNAFGATDITFLTELSVPERIIINNSVGSMVIRVPETVGINLSYSSSIGSIKVNNVVLDKDGERYFGIQDAEQEVSIQAETAIGEIRIENIPVQEVRDAP